MRANYKLSRLYIEQDIALGTKIEIAAARLHYLMNVMRLETGTELLVFNGRDGEWLVSFEPVNKKRALLRPKTQTRPQPDPPDLLYCFAPLKHARLDYMIQKATEMGAGVLQPVLTQHCQVGKIKTDRIAANAVEAAEQCGVLSIPMVGEPVKLAHLLDGWDRSRRLIFCDEDAETNNPVAALNRIEEKKLAVLIGPEGGFSEQERELLRSSSFVTPIPLGPRILRADTAAVAALAVIQATIGDWN